MHENRVATITRKVMDFLESMDDSQSPEQMESFMADACMALTGCASAIFIVLPTTHQKCIRETAKILKVMEQTLERSPDHA